MRRSCSCGDSYLRRVKTRRNENQAPTLARLIAADRDGLTVRNPDNGLIFRIVYVNWQGVLPAVKIYRRHGRRAVRSPLMGHDWIERWVADLEFCRWPRRRMDRPTSANPPR